MSDPPARLDAALARARRTLAAADGDAAVDAQVLLAHVLQRARAWLIAHGDAVLTPEQARRFDALVERRAAGEPVAYLTGAREFWSLHLEVDARVLIPRPDTECLVEQALERLAPGRGSTVLDAGTGSGAVALAIATERPAARVVASDRDRSALQVAAGNARRHAPGRLALVQADWLAAFANAALDLIASNPPYVAPLDPHLVAGDVRFEPRAALVAGEGGLAAIAALTAEAPRCLNPGGWLLVEHGAEQAAAVRALFAGRGFSDVATARDLAGRERVTAGRRP